MSTLYYTFLTTRPLLLYRDVRLQFSLLLPNISVAPVCQKHTRTDRKTCNNRRYTPVKSSFTTVPFWYSSMSSESLRKCTVIIQASTSIFQTHLKTLTTSPQFSHSTVIHSCRCIVHIFKSSKSLKSSTFHRHRKTSTGNPCPMPFIPHQSP